MKKIILIIVVLAGIASAQAQDRNFARTYQTNVLPKGAIDLEFWHTSRFGHDDQFFHAQDQRLEVEFGLGKTGKHLFILIVTRHVTVLLTMEPQFLLN